MIRVLIVCATRIYREGLAQVLGKDSRFEVAGMVDSMISAGVSCEEIPDVVLLDFAMPSSPEEAGYVRTLKPETSIVALAIPDSEEQIVACATAGVTGFVTREANSKDLAQAITDSMSGDLRCTPRMVGVLFRQLAKNARLHPSSNSRTALTVREKEVGGFIVLGLSNKEISNRLNLSENTIKQHVQNIFEKLNVHQRGKVALILRAQNENMHAPS